MYDCENRFWSNPRGRLLVLTDKAEVCWVLARKYVDSGRQGELRFSSKLKDQHDGGEGSQHRSINQN